MKKRSIWLGIAIATAIAVIWQWQSLISTAVSVLQSTSPANTNSFTAAQTVVLPTVDSDRLWADLEALNFQRFSDSDRQKTRDYITQQLQAAGWSVQLQPFEGGVNLYAEQQGRDPEQGSILLGAHYDTVEASPGADDNATAVATLLEAARLWPQTSMTRTLKLLFFDLEEAGLLGSQAFVQQPEQLDRLQAAVILDMIGYVCNQPGCQRYPPLPVRPPTDRGNFLAVLSDQGHAHLLENFAPTAQSTLPQIITLGIPTFGGVAPDWVRSDHAPFWRQGVGAVLVTDTANFRNPHYHQPSDTLETIDRPFLVGSAQVVINAIWRLLG